MKINTGLFFFFISPFFIYSQTLFEKIEDGTLVGFLSDSRSVNFVDANNDGWEDVFISNGANPGTKNLFYLNNGDGTFNKISSDDIVSHAAPFDGATFADIDNDGDLDAAVVTWYGLKNYLYFGNGDGTFDYDENAPPSTELSFSETAAWGDADGDGYLDLYVTNSTDNSGTPLKNSFYKNNGDGSFTQITSGPHAINARASRSVNWIDYDNDCDLDLFVSNESNQADNLYRNDGNGNFSLAANPPSQSNRSTMSSSWGDVDNDGDLDLFVSNAAYFGEQDNQLFLNNNDGTFTEITTGDLATDGGCSYGSNFGDYDNDGDLDLVVSNGYCNGSIVNFLYKNDGTGNFTRDMESAVDLNTPCSYGAAWGDINNDGFLDLGIATCKNSSGSQSPKNIFYENIGNENNWTKIKPIGTEINRSAIGAKVFVTADINGVEITQMREISSQSGYCGQNNLYAHFGLADATVVKEIKIQFSCGSDTVLNNIPVNQLIELTEGVFTSTDDVYLNNKIDFKINPNPTDGQFNISVNSSVILKNVELHLMDTMGKVVFKNKIDNIPIGFFEKIISMKKNIAPPGCYILKLMGDGFMKTEKLIIQ